MKEFYPRVNDQFILSSLKTHICNVDIPSVKYEVNKIEDTESLPKICTLDCIVVNSVDRNLTSKLSHVLKEIIVPPK